MQMYRNIEEYLNIIPKIEYMSSYDPKLETGWQGVKALWYEGATYKGKPTKVFGYIGYPTQNESEKVPAVVLVHGGGGHAYAHWVKLWNDRGYAAIAIDTTGFLPDESVKGLCGVESGANEKYVRELYGEFADDNYTLGPGNDEFRGSKLPIEEQWAYHAITDIILAHNILRQDERIDENKIGIVGVSWGGVMTSLVMGYDDRYKFAIPFYGCGYLGYGVKKTSLEFLKPITQKLWGPEQDFEKIKFPVLWTCALKDASFCCYSNSRSYLDTKKSGSQLSIQADLFHSHAAAWEREEAYRFADAVLMGKLPLAGAKEEPQDAKEVVFEVEVPDDYEDLQVRLIYLTEPFSYAEDGTPTHVYNTKELSMVDNMVRAEIPNDAKNYYFEFKGTVGGKDLISTTALIAKKGEHVMNTKMPIVGFYGPCRRKDVKRGDEYDFVTDDIYKKIKDVGISLINFFDQDYGIEDEKQSVLDCLALAEKYGISMFVRDKRIGFDATEEDIANCIQAYNHYSSFKGIQVLDEPMCDAEWCKLFDPNGKRAKISDLCAMATKINKIDGLYGFSNLVPFREHIGQEAYDAYVAEYIETCHPKVISFDYYLYDPHYSVSHPGYFINLSIVRENSLKYNVPFWSFIQAGTYWNDGGAELEPTPNDTPKRGQMLWNVNTSLAYGAKGIEYFPLIQPYWFSWQENNTHDYQRNGLIGANGVPTQWYDYAKEANKQIAAVGEVLLQSDSKEILAVGTVAQAETGKTMKSYGALASANCKNNTYGAVIGCFDYLGRDAFYVVNYKHSQYGYGDTEEVTLNFIGSQKYRIISEQLAEEMPMTGEGVSCTLNLAEGGAALVIIE